MCEKAEGQLGCCCVSRLGRWVRADGLRRTPVGLKHKQPSWSVKPRRARPGIVGMRGPMVIRLRPRTT